MIQMGFKDRMRAVSPEARMEAMKAKGGALGRALEQRDLGKTFGVRIVDGVVESTRTGERVALPARASVESAGDLDRRVTVTRFLLTGPFAFALRKTKDGRQLFLVVEGERRAGEDPAVDERQGFVLEVPADKAAEASELAMAITTAAGA